MDWLRGQGFSTCEVWQRVLSLRFNGRCPSCFRTFSSRQEGVSDATRPLAGVWQVFTSDWRVRSSVPKGVKDAWSRCLIAALADVVAHRDVKLWTDILTLPALVLPAPSRGGRKHVLRQEGETRGRCLDWLSGIRADLWAPLPVRSSKDRGPPAQVDDSDILPASVVARVTTLIQEGALRLGARASMHFATRLPQLWSNEKHAMLRAIAMTMTLREVQHLSMEAWPYRRECRGHDPANERICCTDEACSIGKVCTNPLLRTVCSTSNRCFQQESSNGTCHCLQMYVIVIVPRFR